MLFKFRLNMLVVFSAAMAYLVALQDDFSWTIFIALCFGGFLVTGASNTLNQVLERDTDPLMKRTANRPLAVGRMSVSSAIMIAGFTSMIGITFLAYINPWTAVLGTLSLILYSFLYTPMKRISPVAVFIGAIPGALPTMIGCVAAQGELTALAIVLFGIQFMWQFPHFWAIGWFLFDDYKKGGFFMLPTGKRDRTTAVQVVFYSVCTVLSSLIPAFGVTGAFYITPISAVIIGGLGIWFVYYGLRLYKQKTDTSAKQLMLVSVSYITLLQIIYVADKFIR
jgi:protoheme IX farnesyltransferase